MTKPKYTILTILMGSYDTLREIEHPLEEDVEYLCVTDRKDLSSNTWTIIYDEDLDKLEYNGFDRTFRVRYNLFKYAHADICVRVDASLAPIQPITPLVDKFIDGDYDIGILIHPFRTNIWLELTKWAEVRQYDNVELQTQFILDKFNYEIKKHHGLYQLNFSINRRSEITDQIDKEMLEMVHECQTEDMKPHLNRLDQTIFSAYLNTQHSDKKIFACSANITAGKYFNQYSHNGTEPVNADKHWLTAYVFNDNPIDSFE